jgi:positive phototaxis protein PixI
MVSDTVSRQQVQQYLRFQINTGVYGMLPTQQLTEISNLSLSQVVPIPDTLPEVIGVYNWRGEILWVMDLGYWLGFDPLHTESFGKGQLNVMIIHHQGQRLGLGIKSVDQMIWCDAQQIRPASQMQTTPTLTQCLCGYWSAPTGEVVLALDGGTVIEGLKEKLD